MAKRRKKRGLSGGYAEHEETARAAMFDARDDFANAESSAGAGKCMEALKWWGSGVSHYAIAETNSRWAKGATEGRIRTQTDSQESKALKALVGKCIVKRAKK